jgi:uncharacterized protein (DUF885 family)
MSAIEAKYRQLTGARFDLGAFHDAVLGGGALPLDMLRRSVRDRALEARQR